MPVITPKLKDNSSSKYYTFSHGKRKSKIRKNEKLDAFIGFMVGVDTRIEKEKIKTSDGVIEIMRQEYKKYTSKLSPSKTKRLLEKSKEFWFYCDEALAFRKELKSFPKISQAFSKIIKSFKQRL